VENNMNQAPQTPTVRRRGLPLAVAAGFTLIELLVVVAIIAIVTRFAVPAYWYSVVKAHRADAKTGLLDLAAREERYFTQYNTYTSVASSLGYGATATFPINLPGGTATTDYHLTVSASSTTGYTLTATPPTGSTQADDTTCFGYQLDNLGNQYNFLTVGGAASSISGCW
jgi:type IV pilus assembly protein PilE